MSHPNSPFDPELLSAYVDDQLDEATRLKLARYLAEHPQAAAKVEAYRDQNEALQRMAEQRAAEAMPQRFRDLVLGSKAGEKAPRSHWWRKTGLPLGAVAILILSAYAGWLVRGALSQRQMLEQANESFVQQAVSAYNLYSQSGMSPTSGVQDNDLSKFAAWFKQNLGTDVDLPRLKPKQYKVVAARILPSVDGTAGQVVFTAHNSGKAVAWYFQVSSSRSEAVTTGANKAENSTQPQYRSVDNVSVDYWQAGNVHYALVSSQDHNTLRSLTQSLWKAAAD